MAGVGTAIYQFVYKDIFGEQYLAVVVNQDEKWGYINEKGKEVIPCEYDFARNEWTNGVTVIGKKAGGDEEGHNHRSEVGLQYEFVDGFHATLPQSFAGGR